MKFTASVVLLSWFLGALAFQSYSKSCSHPFKIVVLGSSTSAGAGASPIDSSYVKRLQVYLKDSVNAGCTVINLALGGATTRAMQPTWYGGADTARNIDKAITHKPDGILINYPSNDVANNYTLTEQKANFQRVMAKADSAKIPVWVTTTQPRNFGAQAQRDSQIAMKNWIIATYPKMYINFWDGIAETNGQIIPAYNSGDGVHLNNAGHRLIFQRVVQSNMADRLCKDVPPSTGITNIKGDECRVYIGNSLVTMPSFGKYKAQYAVYDATGKMIAHGNYKQNVSIPVSSAGVYMIRLVAENGEIQAKKVWVQGS